MEMDSIINPTTAVIAIAALALVVNVVLFFHFRRLRRHVRTELAEIEKLVNQT
jgi:Co/Zn/Cd efflux system component